MRQTRWREVQPRPAPAGSVPLRLALAGGGTGGHLVPGLHLLEAWKEAELALADLLWLHGTRAIEERVLQGLEARLEPTTAERLALALEPSGGGAPHPLGTGLRAPRAVLAARRALVRHQSQAVLGLGGFVSVPAILAARSLGLPAFLLEVNAVPGRATRALAPLCARVFHAWRGSLPAGEDSTRHRYVGSPLSPRFLGPPSERERARARTQLGFPAEGPLLLVLGGSQGALGINRFVSSALAHWRERGLSVLHQVGPGRLAEAGLAGPAYRAVEYVDDVALALGAADCVLARGGASTLAEIAARGLPACIVPYPHHADRHQERNAQGLGDGAWIVAERDLGVEIAERLAGLAGPAGRNERERMSAALLERAPHDGARRIHESLVEVCQTLRWKRGERSSGMGA